MKHAYLIIAHNQFELLKTLVRMLDNKNNDIYIHVDKRAVDFNEQNIKSCVENSSVEFIKRIAVRWAGAEMMEAELMLLEKATEKYHDYYHLLSGADLPIKSNKEIDKYFERNSGKEYVSFDKYACENKDFYDRLMFYHFKGLGNKLVRKLDRVSCKFQKLIGINRMKNLKAEIKKGSQWFDITHDFAVYISDQMRNISMWKKVFKYSSYCDEMFIHSILYNSEFYKNQSSEDIRFIDWSNHGKSPETLTEKDFDKLLLSDCLYARKFSLSVDDKIVERVFDELSN